MSTAPAPNPRASLLAGLRTGGVRSVSATVPHTAAPTGSFSVPRFPPQQHPSYYSDEEDDQLADMPAQALFAPQNNTRMPMTAAVDGSANRFAHQQTAQRGMNPNSVPFSPGFNPNQNQMVDPTFQMQMMQLELMRIQTLQVQQMMVQQQAQQQQQQQRQPARRASAGFVPPATAGPMSTSFDLRSAALNAQLRRQDPAQLGVAGDDQVPMTAALGGKFGSRNTSLSMNGRLEDTPGNPGNNTTVISGGTSLGNMSSNNAHTPSKSDQVTSWRRGGNNNSVLSGNNRTITSPSVKITPPPGERVSPPPVPPLTKSRPQPLQFNNFASQPAGVMATVDFDFDEDAHDIPSSGSSKSNGSNSPTTPPSLSHESPLSQREEASKKLYEGLGLGRPSAEPAIQQPAPIGNNNHRMVSQPVRQPRGPPSGADELGPKNFARMVRRKAIGGLGMLANARERREFVEAY
jgi:hypothetical protein